MSETLDTVLRKMIEEVVRQAGTALMREWLTLPRARTTPKASSERMLLTSREAAAQLAVSERHLHRMTRNGNLPFVRVGNAVRYHVESLRQWILASEGIGQTSAATTTLISHKCDMPAQYSSPKPANTGRNLSRPNQKTLTNRRSVRGARRPRKEIQSTPSRRIPETSAGGRVSPFTTLLRGMGIDSHTFPSMTNGDLMRAAGVDVPTLHAWIYLGRALPVEALGKPSASPRRWCPALTGSPVPLAAKACGRNCRGLPLTGLPVSES